jgi:hypothetical protein
METLRVLIIIKREAQPQFLILHFEFLIALRRLQDGIHGKKTFKTCGHKRARPAPLRRFANLVSNRKSMFYPPFGEEIRTFVSL